VAEQLLEKTNLIEMWRNREREIIDAENAHKANVKALQENMNADAPVPPTVVTSNDPVINTPPPIIPATAIPSSLPFDVSSFTL
jgi:hypothetical protein